ncbi:putative membrane protein (DUF2339) [Bernardetia litoralis DSM 6794]|uniref:Putative membrane protein (DUF2339) n=1 Tax=Bernardetia litoralis (strain ATCC 23117 / DSM 6794 / NBRC 15988 / NCIMB 1366 / Fx l1 / Sio-4) TaxID=880071 RepID=I4APN8_BERLS|nr:DUF2339 domain-containing protein [Bernardetia litoralis]AFM05923.1 putative membrane protein (DUF2339) [Bernardetia litoralis DSM 6794]
MDKKQQIEELLRKLYIVESKQTVFGREIKKLRVEIEGLKNETSLKSKVEGESILKQKPIFRDIPSDFPSEAKKDKSQEKQEPIRRHKPVFEAQPKAIKEAKIHQKSSIEKFIGENVIYIIAILIIVLGVGIGVKYAIDNEMISPLTRIIFAYLVGAGLLGFAIYLKPKYEKFSAGLLSGAMAIFYFVTFMGYDFYGLFPKEMAFGLMVAFTIFTVVASLNYDRQIIAHIGLVGAYAVPFLLSDGSGKVMILFIYMTIINLGILAISIKKYWKPLYLNAFVLTWLVVLSWYGMKYNQEEHFSLTLIFSTIFFLIFYISFLAYKIRKEEMFNAGDVILMLFNSFIFYGIGFATLSTNIQTENLVGLFTLGQAIIHFGVSVVLYKNKLADRNLFYLASGLVLVFITIAVPVQLDGNWVTLIWSLQAALLFWIGRTKKVGVYESLSFPLMILATFSMLQDWGIALQVSDYLSYEYTTDKILPKTIQITPIFNVIFLTSAIFAASFFAINFINKSDKYISALQEKSSSFLNFITVVITTILLFALYLPLVVEISVYFNQLLAASKIEIMGKYDYTETFFNYDLYHYQAIWILNYTLLFFIGLGFYCIKKVENQMQIILYYLASIVILFIFMTGGLFELSELRESYISQELSKYYEIGSFNLMIRYISFGLVAGLLVTLFRLAKQDFLKFNFIPFFDFILHVSVLWLLSAELIHILNLSSNADAYKLGLSILWGVYSLFVVVLGIWKKKKYLRLGGLIWFGITLVKLFFYDIAALSTISKVIVFLSLGILLLIISFLYNKYKDKIEE